MGLNRKQSEIERRMGVPCDYGKKEMLLAIADKLLDIEDRIEQLQRAHGTSANTSVENEATLDFRIR